MLERSVRYVLLASALVVLAMAAAGCGGGGDDDGDGSAGAEAAIDAVKQDRPKQPVSEYEEVLLDLRDAAAEGEIYDAYGFAEYMPLSQRAAIDAFCFVTESLLDGGETERFGEPAYVAGKVRARARIEFDHGDPAEIGASEMARRSASCARSSTTSRSTRSWRATT
jgi:hypothetical protein